MGVSLSYFSHSFAHLLIHSIFQHLLSTDYQSLCYLALSLHLWHPQITVIMDDPPGGPLPRLQSRGCPPSLGSSCLLPLCFVLCCLPHFSDESFILPLLLEQVTFLVGVWAENRISHRANHHTDAKHFLCDTIRHTLCSSSPGILLLNLFIK